LRQKHPFDTKLLCYPRQNPTGYPGKSTSADDSVFDEQDHQNQVQSDEMKMEQILEEEATRKRILKYRRLSINS